VYINNAGWNRFAVTCALNWLFLLDIEGLMLVCGHAWWREAVARMTAIIATPSSTD
jgi:hypothetical protein